MRLYVVLIFGWCGNLIVILVSVKSTSSLSMYPQEMSLVDEAFKYLAQVISHLAHWTNPPDTTNPLNASHLNAIISLLERWPRETLYPGRCRDSTPRCMPLLTKRNHES